MRRSFFHLIGACAIVVATVNVSAAILTYATTLSVTPGSVTVAGSYDDDGVFYPNYPEFAANPDVWLTPGDGFQLTFTIDDSVPLSAWELPPFGTFFNARDYVVDSTFQPLPQNVGRLSREFTFGPSFRPGASGSSGGINLEAGYLIFADRYVYISYLSVGIALPVNVAGDGLPIGELMGPLDGITPYAAASLGPYWDSVGDVRFQASPLVRVVPEPSLAGVLGIVPLLAVRRRRTRTGWDAKTICQISAATH